MTPRERWNALMNGRPVDRPPCDYWATPELTTRLMGDLGCASERALYERLGIDKLIHLAPRHPQATEDTWHLQSLFSIWKIGVRNVPYADGLGYYEEAVFHPLASARTVAEIERFEWPDPNHWDVACLAAQCDQWPDYPLLAGSSEPFYLYCRLRGMELALSDLIDNPAIVECALARISSIDLALTRRILEAVGDRILFVYAAEDLGTQESLLMSPAMWRRFLRPGLVRLAELAHSYGVRVFHHDDGAIRPMITDLISAGIDLLNPIQWRCKGMDRETLARDFGSRLVFHGGIDNQHTLPFGSPDDVRREVRDNLRIFRNARGYVVAPCHNLQANTPTANITAMYDAVRESA